MKNLILTTSAIVAIVFAVACGGGSGSTTAPATQPSADTQSSAATTSNANTPSNDPKGEGKFTNVVLTHPLDQDMIATGQKVYDVKCSSCHKLTDEKLVGPGWKGVTQRHKPEWIMNFVTNTDEMLNKDAQAMSLLEVCLVKMPNQNLTDDEARAILEFQRNNDGDK
ncbi:MAG TPA: cytochrome c [Bacteroidia bacterium]|nr:cytochrome c [Bacteroidia bacterium]